MQNFLLIKLVMHDIESRELGIIPSSSLTIIIKERKKGTYTLPIKEQANGSTTMHLAISNTCRCL